ncbi:hypothetical protein [Mucilaginibacter antarcticus]|uniref:hypothetical protein n=1 Tax=Mucilaginibacter antarcticus TaxID=1855725 RepID=UPI00362D8954
MMKKYLLLLALAPWCFAKAQTPELKRIFNGRDLQGWTTFAEKRDGHQHAKSF